MVVMELVEEVEDVLVVTEVLEEELVELQQK